MKSRRRAAKAKPPPLVRGPLRRAPVSAAQIRLLRRSFAQVQPHISIAALAFYRELFTLDPRLRELFQSDIEVQGRKVMEALEYTIVTIEDTSTLLPVLEALGRRHVTYRVRLRHYETVIRAILLAFRQTLGKSFTREVEAAWRTALEFVAENMKRGAAPVLALGRDSDHSATRR